jgi:hypothetical protein
MSMDGLPYAHELAAGDAYAPLAFVASPELNQYFLYALGIFHPRYLEHTDAGPPMVHPVVLLHHTPRTRSPSFRLAPGMGSVFARDRTEFMHPARVGLRYHVSWLITDVYEKRGRQYQDYRAEITGEDGLLVLRRDMSSAFRVGAS